MTTGYIATCTPLKQNVNLRERGSTGAKVVGMFAYRDVLPVTVVGVEWLRVEHNGVEVFVARHVVRLDMG
jgi:hypothetical protein